MRRAVHVLLLLLCACPAAPLVARAQTAASDTASDADRRRAEAAALFQAGRAAAEAGLWSEAVVRFERSFELFPTASALYNLAVAQRALGRHVSARDTLARLLSEHDAELSAEQRQAAQALLSAESLRAARLTLAGLPAARFGVHLDDQEREDSGERPLVFELDPGEHRLVLQNEGYEPYRWEGTLADGQHVRLDVDLTAVQPAAPAQGESLVESPWFWVVTVAAVMLVAGAAVGTYFALQSKQIQPLSDMRYRL